MTRVRFVAIGDSFTEGVGDEQPDGTVRGWADLTAQGWADAIGEPIQYANLAIRGRLADPIVAEQLEPALALHPTHLAFNGGGNDMLRPGDAIERVAQDYVHVLRRCDEEGVRVIALAGADPTAQLPLGRLIHRRGDRLAVAVAAALHDHPDAVTAWNWSDRELARPSYWSADRLHMNSRGHHRVAARVLTALGLDAPVLWWSMPDVPDQHAPRGMDYYRRHVIPWVKRRLTHTSSGDGRSAKYPHWMRVDPFRR